MAAGSTPHLVQPAGQMPRAYSAAERIAVIITIMGEPVARPILEKLDDEYLTQVLSALGTVPSIPVQDMRAIIQGFTERAQSSMSGLLEKGAEARRLIAEITTLRQSSKHSLDSLPANMDAAAPQEDVWEAFSREPAARIAAYLNRLPPNLISMVLRKLAPPVAADVLCGLDAQKMRPVLGFMVQAATQDPGIDRALERMIRLEFLSRKDESETEDTAHLGSLGEMLSLIPSGRRNELVDFLKTNHQSRLDAIQKSLFTIEGLPDMLPRNAVPVIFRELDTPTITRLIKSLEPEHSGVIEFLLANISSRLANQVREDVAAMQLVTGLEAETLQRDFLSILMRLKRSGAIEIS